MFWADELLKNQKGKQVVNDSFTPSGMVHMGSLKGPVIHDVLQKALKEKGEQVEFRYGFDDFDPVDGLASNLYLSHEQYLGVPLFLAPSPKGQGSFADYYITHMKGLLSSLGIHPEYYRTSQLYKEGAFNKAIQIVLDDEQGVRDVYGSIYKKTIPSDWYPFQVICPKCGKLGTTKITRWDGKEVSFVCKKDLVKWAQGCSTAGKISPFDGNGKMPWKVEWAAKWFTFGVTIEGAGKDHASAGGSYDIAMKLCSDVFNTSQPLKLGYEFFLSGGKKMSSSKGLGLTGEKLLEALGPQRARFIMIKTPPNQAVEFTPKDTLVIPKLFDDYQSFAESKDDDHRRVFQFSQVDTEEKVPNVRFQTLAQWVQMPNMEEHIKRERLEEWAKYARIWVERYAPELEKFIVQKNIPEQTKKLSDSQKQFLKRISEELQKEWSAEDFQKNLFEWAKEIGISSKEAFAAIYLSLIGKDHGPKAAWLILSLDKGFVKKRFQEV